jgi:predicted TPR repeat methyltransferase
MALPQAADDASDLLHRADSLLAKGRSGAARPLLNAAMHRTSESPATFGLEARLLECEGRPAEALAVLERAVAAFPGSVQLRMSRAAARCRANDLAGAAADAAEAVCLAPRLARAKAVLGASLLALGQFADARACLSEAVAAEPADVGYRLALARAQEADGDAEAASRTLEEGIARRPDHIELRSSAILLRLRRGEFQAAEQLAEAARRSGVVDACVFGLLGHARSSLGRYGEAAEAYEEARKMSAEDPHVRHLVAAAGLAADATKAAPEYVTAVFDGYASRFDAHLVELGYRIPGVIRRELEQIAPAMGVAGLTLDLGCGTGLLAVAVADLLAGPIIGVDLSGGMLIEAARRTLYAELHRLDIEDFLARETRQFGLVMAGDVLPYFGDLGPVFRAVAGRLLPMGCFMLSLEALPAELDRGDGWRLGRLGRYAHTSQHVTAAAGAAGLAIVDLRSEVVRLEAEAPVAGLFVRLTKASA